MDFLFGDQNKREIKEYEKIIYEILRHKRVIVSLSDEELKDKTIEFKERLSSGETLDDILPEAFAVAREASRRYLGKEQREVQLMGAMALHNGDVAEMKTGEGKTLTAPVAAYLNALTGKKVHIATSNDYLANRDAMDMRSMFEGLGLSVGVVTEERLDDKTKDIERRKNAYGCDIVYGSGNAFAFDYLRDNTAKTKEEVVRGEEAPGFIIIDEADQILVNDAVMPFKLSGTLNRENITSLEAIVQNLEKRKLEKEIKRNSSNANAFVYKLFKDIERCGQFRSVESMEIHQGGNKEATEKAQKKYNVLFCRSEQAQLTERGWLEAFRYFKGQEIDDFINNNPSLITEDSNFELDKDYSIDAGIVSLTLSGVEKAVDTIPEMKGLNDAFYSSSDFYGLSLAIDNALKAYFVLEKGKEYVLEDTLDEGIVKKKVMLVSNGRTQEGRVYSDGLQQAIELKEKKLNADKGMQIVTTKEHDELASVSQKAFYSIYPKVSGMTGTSSRELFETVYNMNTISIPKHSEYDVSDEEIDRIYRSREDKETVLFETDEEKTEAVVTSVLESIKKGQPVLIGTQSVTESNKLYEELSRRGISCQKLNAENAELEGKIISKAGTKGTVTISTQMAGRGTDIKLGGELEDKIKLEKERIANLMAEQIKNDIPIEIRRKQAIKYLEEHKMDIVISSATIKLEEERQELIDAGGLKVIGYGHYSTKRDDDQLRGRAARQADPGVTEFYTSVNDLRKTLGVPKYKIDRLHEQGLKNGSPLTGEIVDKVIESAQLNREGLLTQIISSTQDVDYNLSIMRKKIYNQRMRMINGEDVKENMLYIIESSVRSLIGRNLPEDSYGVTHKKKIKSSGLNINNFIIDVEETFGFDLTEEFEKGAFKNLGELEKYLSDKAKEQYKETRSKNGDERQDEIDRANIVGTIDDAWLTFNDNLEDIKIQNSLNNIAQNKNFDEVYAMKRGFNKAMIDSKIQMLGKMFGKQSSKTRKDEITDEVIVEESEDLNEYRVNSEKTYSNLSIRPAKVIATVGNKIKTVKDRIKYQFELVSVEPGKDSDGVQQIEFDNHEKKDNTYTSIKM